MCVWRSRVILCGSLLIEYEIFFIYMHERQLYYRIVSTQATRVCLSSILVIIIEFHVKSRMHVCFVFMFKINNSYAHIYDIYNIYILNLRARTIKFYFIIQYTLYTLCAAACIKLLAARSMQLCV